MPIDTSAIKPGAIIYCHTADECESFLAEMNALGYTWNSGDSLLTRSGIFDWSWNGNCSFYVHPRERITRAPRRDVKSVPFASIFTDVVFEPSSDTDFSKLLFGDTSA